MSPPRRSPLGVTVLAMLAAEPMHTYRLRQLIHQWGKDRIVNVRQPASIYQAVERLERLGLIEVVSVDQAENRPERTVYGLSEDGRRTLRTWMQEMLTEVDATFPGFPVALSFLPLLPVEQARERLRERSAALGRQIDEIDTTIRADPELDPLYLVEEEYRLEMLLADRRWTDALAERLRDGRLSWAAEHGSPL